MAYKIVPKNTNLPILATIDQYAPRRWKRTSNPKSRYMMACPLPGHNDAEHSDGSGSFSVNGEETLFYCFGCGGRGNGYQLDQLLSAGEVAIQPPRPSLQPLQHNAAQPSRFLQKQSPLQGATISDVAAAKGLDEDYLKYDLSWEDSDYLGSPAIKIPYPDETNGDVQVRYRVAISGDCFRWDTGAKTRLYGIWELARIKKYDYVVLVEGETDYANMDFHGFSVLAVAGAQNFKPEWASLLAGIENIYAWEEPDEGGAAFVRRLAAHFPNLKVITPPEGIKDASDMAVKMGDRFADLMHELVDTAKQDTIKQDTVKQDTVKQDTVKQSEDGITVRRGANFTERRQSVADAYEYGGDTDTATQISRCAVWRRAYQYGCGLVEGRTFHCGKRGCPNCTIVNLTRFFAEKMDIVEQISVPYLVQIPALYEVCVRELGQENMAGEFSRGVSQVRKLLSDWTKYEGKKCDLAKNHMYSIRCAIDTSGVARFGAVILGDTPVTPIASWFEKRLGRPLIIEEERNLQLANAINRFKSLTVTGFTWCTHDQFLAWCASQKSKKLIQGKGRFSGVSGSKATLSEPPATEICPDHGVEEPVTRLRKIGPAEVWIPFNSPHTQRTHYRLVGPISGLITDDG